MAKNIIVIGGGPGGYVAAIRAAQLGAEVHLVEKENLGGTCLNVGCIPTKVLLHTADLYQAVKYGQRIGLKGDLVELDWSALINRKKWVVQQLVDGVSSLLQANGVGVHKGVAELMGPYQVRVGGSEAVLTADAVILASGSVPIRLKLPGSDLPGVMDSTGALELKKPPQSMVIVGGGYIGMEFASLFAGVGVKVRVVELLPEILPGIDAEVALVLKRELLKIGVEFYNGATLTAVEEFGKGLKAIVEQDGQTHAVETEKVLVAVGRRAFTDGLGLDQAGIKLEHGKIVVDAKYRTSQPNVYAIGDCNEITMLAHAASHQGIDAVEHIMGVSHREGSTPIVPACIYTRPEIASVGMTEEKIRERGMAFRKGVFPLVGNGKAIIEEGEHGFIKILAGEKHGEILGVHMIGPRVTEIIGEVTLAMRLEATLEELVTTIHAHPTVSEAIGEAALAGLGRPIHWPYGTRAK